MISLLVLLINGCSGNDTPFVINRATNRVEFSELLLGYNYNQADNRSVEVVISFAIRHVLVYSQRISLSCEIFQTWYDSRLKYSGAKSITIPKSIKIWKPDTNFVNSDVTYGAESLRLYSDGNICWKQRAVLAFPCVADIVFKQDDVSALNCSLIIGSFDNSGAKSIVYTVGSIIFKSNLNPSYNSLMMNYTSTTLEEVALNGESNVKMELKKILLPLVTENRKRFADNSLLLVIDSVKICNGEMDLEKSLPKSPAGLNNLTLLKVTSGNDLVQGYAGEIRYWQTKPYRNLDEIIANMKKKDNLYKSSLKILEEITSWQGDRTNNEEFATVIRFTFSSDNESFVSDGEVLTCLEYSLQTHFMISMLLSVEEIKQVALPLIIFRQLWVVITESKLANVSMKLYDFEGFECGYIKGITFNNGFLECFGNFSEKRNRTTEYEASENVEEKLRRNSSRFNERRPYDVKEMIQESEKLAELDKTHSMDSADKEICHLSDCAADDEKKLLISDRIRKVVEMIIQKPCNDDQASFLSFGFDSLKLSKLDFALQREFSGNFLLPYGCSHYHPSVAALSEYILTIFTQQNNISDKVQSINFQLLDEKLITIIRSGAEISLSAAQKRLVFLNQLDPGRKLAFIETLKFKVKDFKTNKFQKTFNRVIARHTVLRTIYTVTGQTVLSLTEAYFLICIESDITSRLWKPIELFDISPPMRVFVATEEDSKGNEKLKDENFSDHTCQEENEWIQKRKNRQVMMSKFTNTSVLIIIQLHHIMIDGFSIKLLINELHTLYCENKPLRPAVYQYGHYVILEDQQRQDFEGRKLREDFWQHLIHEVTLQTLPLDETKHCIGKYLGRCLQVGLDSGTKENLKNLAVHCSATQFSVLLANFQLLLYKRFGFKDSCIGIAVAQREISELSTVLGCLLNVVPLINTIDSNDQVHNFIAKSCNRLNECIRKQMQFDDLIATLQLERDSPNLPLFQVLFILDDNNYDFDINRPNNLDDGTDNKEEIIKQYNESFQNYDSNFAQYDQVWCFQYRGENITIIIEYNDSRFCRNTLETMVHQYFRLLNRMSQNLHVSVQNIKMISSVEEFDNYRLRIKNRCDFPQKCTVLDLVKKQNKMNPYCNKIIQEGVTFSNIFLQRKSNQLARFLTQKWLQFLGENMQKDSFVVLIFDRSIFFLLIIFALWKSGIGIAPLNPEIFSGNLDEILEKFLHPGCIYECKEKLIREKLLQDFQSQTIKKQNIVFKHDINEVISLISRYSDQELRKKLTEQDLAYMTFTSGSTGKPKQICTEFYGLNNLLLNYAEQLHIKPSSNIYQVVNPSFDIFFADLLEAQTNGASLQLASQKIPSLEEMSTVTHAYIMPAYLSAIPIKQFKKIMNLNLINFGGDYIQSKVLQDAIHAGLHFYNQYGVTEHSIYSTCKLMKVGDKISSVGKPFRNICFSIRDCDKNLCGKRVTGICCISGPGISRGYYDNPCLNQKSFLNNDDLTQLELLLNSDDYYFWTGDLAKIENSAGEMFFHGRNDFKAKIRGMQVDITTIEALLGQHPLVKECIVCLQKTETKELLIAYIICHRDITKEEEGPLVVKSLREYLLIRLPIYMVPSEYVFVREFPLNYNGKVDRKQLPTPNELPKSNMSPKADYILERWEKQVMEIFFTLLPGKAIQLEDSFFEAGGDSLKALIAIQNIKNETGIDLRLRDIFELVSFKAILQRLRENFSTVGCNKVENSENLGLTKSNLNSMQIHDEPKKEAKEDLIKLADVVNKDAEEIIGDGIMAKMMSWPSKNCNEDRQRGKFWFDGSIPVSLQQERLLFLYSFGIEYRKSYELQFLINFHGVMNLKSLNIALNYVMRKHRLLRTIFLQENGKTIQELTSLSECYIEIQRNMLKKRTRMRVELPNSYDTPLLAVAVSDNAELLLILDHLIADGRSIAILTNDIVEFYKRVISEGSIFFDTSETGSSYAEFCLKQRSQLEKFWVALRNADSYLISSDKTELQLQKESGELEKMISKLHNFPPLSLQGDLSNETSDKRCNIIKLKMPVNLLAIKEFCMEKQCTLFAYLLCIFSLTVRSILSNEQKHCFAVVSSALNRTSDTINCVGLFVNTVIIPVDTYFQDINKLISNLQQNIAEALEFQHIPFHYIIQKLNPKRSITGTEAYQISFVLQNASATTLPKIDGVETAAEETAAKYAKFDQAWYCAEFQDYLEMSVEYRIAKYSELKIKYVMNLFASIASQVLSKRCLGIENILEYCGKADAKKLMIENDNLEHTIEIKDTSKQNFILEEILLKIWKEALENPEISVHDNFFAKGGHSLLIPTICYEIEQQISYQCPPQAIFKYQTIRKLAEYISAEKNPKIPTAEEIKIRVCPLQKSLARIYYNAAHSSSTASANDLIKAYQTGFTISLKSINLSKLRYSLNLIIIRHFVLRSTFYCQNNDFFQEIHSGSEIYIALQRMNSQDATPRIPNPFHTIPILCWLIDGTKQEATDSSPWELHFSISHAICDGKSLSIIASELQCAYFESIPNRIGEDFIDFSSRMEQRFLKRYSEMHRFWSRALKDTDAINLQNEKVISAISNTNKCKFFCKKFKDLHKLTMRVAAKCYSSPFSVQLAAFSMVLSEMVTQSPKVVISCPIDMRDSRAKQCVGMCINVLPVVINLKYRNCQDLIRDVARSLADTYVNADLSTEEMEKLCEKYGISNFTNVMIVNNNPEISNHHYAVVNDNLEFTKCALTLFLTQHDQDVVAKIEFKQDLFYSESMSVMLDHWAKIIRRMELTIVTKGEMKHETELQSVDAISYEAGRNEMKLNVKSGEKVLGGEHSFVTENQTDKDIFHRCDYPNISFQHLLRQAIRSDTRLETMTALIGNRESINYRTLNRLIYHTSRTIQEKLVQLTGNTLRTDSVIPVIAQSGIKTVITCLAIIMAGAAYLPIDSTSPSKRILNILEQMEVKFYVTVDKVSNVGQELQNSLISSFQNIIEINLSDSGNDEYSFELPVHLKNIPADLAYVIFTSGTTGKPKGVALAQDGLLNMAVACTRDFWIKPGDCVYQFTNFTFDNSVLEITMALVNGSALFHREDFFMPRKFLKEIKSANITHALLFPGLVDTFEDEEIEELRHLRYWIVGAESASKRVMDCALKSGVNVIQNYGPTETTAYALTRRMKLLDRPNNIGRGIINVIITVRNLRDEMVPKMGVGELSITGVGIMRGYITSNMEERTGKNEEERKWNAGNRRVPGTAVCQQMPSRISFATRDMVRLLTNGDILFLGRYDKQVKIRGHRVELSEVETILCQYPEIKSAKVILKSTGEQQRLVGFIILSDSSKTEFDICTLRKFMLQHLPYYMVPTQYYPLQQFPLTKNSKLDVTALEMLQDPINGPSSKNAEPENSTEVMLLGFFRKVLKDDNISVNDDFFASGGNSFLAAQLAELIEVNSAQNFDIINVFHHRTVRRLSQCIGGFCRKLRSKKTDETRDLHGLKKQTFRFDNIPLSFQQQQFRFLNETKQKRYYELIFIQKFDASLSLQHLKLAFLRLILRQPSLRTIFPEQNYEVHQEILSGTETYFYSSILESGSSSVKSTFRNEDFIPEMINIFQDEEVDFTCQPPVLCAFDATSNKSYAVILRINHIISDAWSTKLLEIDLRDLYHEVLKNRRFNSNSKLLSTYAEYSVEQFERRQSLEKLGADYADKIVTWFMNDQNYNKILENWERNENMVSQVGQVEQNLDFASGEKKQSSELADFRNYSETVFNFEMSRIQKICGSFETTPLVVFLSAFALSLHELSSTNQLIINVPVANRTTKTTNIIGNFLNYLLVNCELITAKGNINTRSTESRNNIDNTASLTEVAIFNTKTDRSFSSAAQTRSMRSYIDSINTTINEIRRFEQVPFTILLKLIRIKLKKLNLPVTELLTRLHKTIFFNFRYGLEEDCESVLGKGETQPPVGCIHEIEVEIDCIKSYYSCKIRMENREKSCKRILILRQRMIFFLQQMSIYPNIQETVDDEHAVIEKQPILPCANPLEGTTINRKLRRIWSECLNKRWIKDDDDFFLEGGTSLLTLKLRSLIKSQLKIYIEIDEIFKYSTFVQLSKFLNERFIKTGCSNNGIKIVNSESVVKAEQNTMPEITGTASWKSDVTKERENLEASKNQQIILFFRRGESNNDGVIVFFHALVGGVTWTYAPIIRQLIRRLPDSFTIIGIQHPDTFSRRCAGNFEFYRSIENLCSKYIQHLDDHLRKAKIRLFIGASFGAILAYQCAVQLQQKGIYIDDIISIDGTSRWRRSTSSAELSYAEHCQQIKDIVKYRVGNMKIDVELLEAISDNAWELLKMMRIYTPIRSLKTPSRLHVTLLKSQFEETLEVDGDDYGWMELCTRTVIGIPFSHDTILHERNIDIIVDIILQSATKAKRTTTSTSHNLSHVNSVA
uniref:oleoyl-[acyl-carrier-protein] hydrolase n=1 Tax=Setaria digitata TaxID=48799 RepID=A0A915PIR2_9BILA